jgi:hypothetical protein
MPGVRLPSIMNKDEAKIILERELGRYRRRSYSELLAVVGGSETFARPAPSGVTYQVAVRVFFDDESRRTLRVAGAIDDGGWCALVPVCDDFIMASDGTFVGE